MLACGTSTLLVLQAPASAEQSAADTVSAGFVPGKGYEIVGAVAPRHAKQIAGSSWSVGAETMDRDFTVYANWKTYLGPLGAKAARLQSGWAKTEKEKGKYDWAWLDEIIPDMNAQGVRPWVCLCYGNPIYPGGGGTGLGGGLPKSEEALAAWDKYVAAIVERYVKQVDQWEIWNEPNASSEVYGELVIRTAKVVRRVQPKAYIIAAAWRDVKAFLEYLKEHDGLGLVNGLTYHPYSYNPDDTYRKNMPKLRDLIAAYSSKITLRQGENGAPSQGGSFGAIAKYDWTEEKQAKWALRRLLGDLGRDIPSSYFSICDMQYPDRRNFKGLLAINDDKTVHHAKHAYYAAQRIMSIFDNTVHRTADFAGKVEGGNRDHSYSLFGYRTDSGANIVTLWRDSHRPGERPEIERLSVTLPGVRFQSPVLVDLLSGKVYAIGGSLRGQTGDATTLRDVPVYDSAIVLAERAAIRISPAAK